MTISVGDKCKVHGTSFEVTEVDDNGIAKGTATSGKHSAPFSFVVSTMSLEDECREHCRIAPFKEWAETNGWAD